MFFCVFNGFKFSISQLQRFTVMRRVETIFWDRYKYMELKDMSNMAVL